MSVEQTWLTALAMDQLGQACKTAGVKVDGFRTLSLVPRLLLERQIMIILTRHRGHARSAKLRSALATAWQERYPTLAEVLKGGLTGKPTGEESTVERWGEWLAGLCRTFGRAPVQMGVQLAELPPPLADETFLAQLEPYWPPEESAPTPIDVEVAQTVTGAEAEEEQEQAVAQRPEWRQERSQLRAKLKSLQQENQSLQRARTSAEHRAAHYQAQLEQVRAEMDALTQRTDWPHPPLLVQQLIRGLMEARRQVLDLESANAELRLALSQTPEGEESDESEGE